MPRHFAALVLAAGLPLAGPLASPRPAPADDGAAATVLRIDLPSGPVLRLGDASARIGSEPGAAAAPVVAGGTAPVRATAATDRPGEKVVATPLRWTDPSGSLTVEGGAAEAQASARSATARAGFGTAGGTGFALANRLFTWEQQEQFLTQVAALDGAVFGPLNHAVVALTPVLSAAGLATPHFERLSPVGLVDTGQGTLAAASAEVAASPRFAAGRAEATLDHVRLLGGFVDARSISTEAVSERSAGGDDRRRGVWFGQLTVAGIPVEVDGGHLRVAGNDPASRAASQPALDLVLAAMRDHGVDLRIGEGRDTPEGTEVTALDMTITAPAGQIRVSVASARATAATSALLPPPDRARAPGGSTDAAPPSAAEPATGAAPSGVRPPDASPAGPGGRASPAGGWAGWGSPENGTPSGPAGNSALSGTENGPPSGPAGDSAASSAARTPPGSSGGSGSGAVFQHVATARALRAVYLLLTTAAAAGALVLPVLIVPVTGRPAPRRRHP